MKKQFWIMGLALLLATLRCGLASPQAFFELIAIKADPVLGTYMEINCPLVAEEGVYVQLGSGIQWVYPGNPMPVFIPEGAAVGLFELWSLRADPLLGTRMEISCPVLLNGGLYLWPSAGIGWVWPGNPVPLFIPDGAAVGFFELLTIKTDPVLGPYIEIKCPLMLDLGIHLPLDHGISWMR